MNDGLRWSVNDLKFRLEAKAGVIEIDALKLKERYRKEERMAEKKKKEQKKDLAVPAGPRVDKGALVASDKPLGEAAKKYMVAIAREYRLPIMGITMMGGRPYVNVTGLDAKVKEKVEETGWDFVGVELEPIQRAEVDPEKRRAGFRASVVFFDKVGFQEALETLKSPTMSKEILDFLDKNFHHRFTDEGWASIASIKMSTLHSVDCINMMASRRATNRAKRQAVGLGLTSVDEMGAPDEGTTLNAEQAKAVEAEFSATGEEAESPGAAADPEKKTQTEGKKDDASGGGAQDPGKKGTQQEGKKASEKQISAIYAISRKLGQSKESMAKTLLDIAGVEHTYELTIDGASKVIQKLQEGLDKK